MKYLVIETGLFAFFSQFEPSFMFNLMLFTKSSEIYDDYTIFEFDEMNGIIERFIQTLDKKGFEYTMLEYIVNKISLFEEL